MGIRRQQVLGVPTHAHAGSCEAESEQIGQLTMVSAVDTYIKSTCPHPKHTPFLCQSHLRKAKLQTPSMSSLWFPLLVCPLPLST